MLFAGGVGPSDPGNFYATCATILSATLIAGILELRRILPARGARHSLTERLSATWLVVSLILGTLFLVNIPAAINGAGGFWADRAHLVWVTAVVPAVGLLLPLAAFLVTNVWTACRPEPVAPITSPSLSVDPAPRRLVWLLVITLAMTRLLRHHPHSRR